MPPDWLACVAIMSFLIHNVTQGSDAWHAARAGVVTASMFKTARERSGLDDRQAAYVRSIKAGTPKKLAAEMAGYRSAPTAEIVARALDGEDVVGWSEAAKKYAFRLAIERISGQPLDDGFETWQMRRGRELEPLARAEHERHAGLIVEMAGFVTTECGRFGASADGLIAPDGGSEYKCLISPETIRDTLLYDDLSDYADQVQGGMWITRRRWWDFCVYCPALESIGRQMTRWRVIRDDDYIEELESDLLVFDKLVSDYETRLRNQAH